MRRRCCVLLIVLAASAGCGRRTGPIAPEVPPPLNVAEPIERTVVDYVDYTGNTKAKFEDTVVPRVTGYLVQKEKSFTEGDFVKEGDLLFEIDPRPYDAQYAMAKAEVAQNKEK